MFWDYNSEGPLLMEYIAEILLPDLFPDLNMVQEVNCFCESLHRYCLYVVGSQDKS